MCVASENIQYTEDNNQYTILTPYKGTAGYTIDRSPPGWYSRECEPSPMSRHEVPTWETPPSFTDAPHAQVAQNIFAPLGIPFVPIFSPPYPKFSTSNATHSHFIMPPAFSQNDNYALPQDALLFSNSHIRNKPIRKRKKRNSERRKEKSRDAARCRRSKESDLFCALQDLLKVSLPPASVVALDKTSVMRVVVATLRTRNVVNDLMESSSLLNTSVPKNVGEGVSPLCSPLFLPPSVSEGGLMQKALNGFLMVLSCEADVVFASKGVAAYLGMTQVDLMGHSLLDLCHPCDQDDVLSLATHKGSVGDPSSNISSSSPSSSSFRQVFLRLKCTLTPKGRSIKLKTASYKVLKVTGRLLSSLDPNTNSPPYVMALASPLPQPPTADSEPPLDTNIFVSKHKMDLTISYVEPHVASLVGFSPSDLVDSSFYTCLHAMDCNAIRNAHQTLRTKGEVETPFYRLLTKGGGFVWVVTYASVVTNSRNNNNNNTSNNQYILALNHVLSEVQETGLILSEIQLQGEIPPPQIQVSPPQLSVTPPSPIQASPNLTQNIQPLSTKIERGSLVSPEHLSPQPLLSPSPHTLVSPYHDPPPPYSQPPPVAATFALLANRTEDMNKGYLTFLDNDPSAAVLKDEPEDLTHLAPCGGDDMESSLEFFDTMFAFDHDEFFPHMQHSCPNISGEEVITKEKMVGKISPPNCVDQYLVTPSPTLHQLPFGGNDSPTQNVTRVVCHVPDVALSPLSDKFNNCSSLSSPCGSDTSSLATDQSSPVNSLLSLSPGQNGPTKNTLSAVISGECCPPGSQSPPSSCATLGLFSDFNQEARVMEERDELNNTRAPYFPLDELFVMGPDEELNGDDITDSSVSTDLMAMFNIISDETNQDTNKSSSSPSLPPPSSSLSPSYFSPFYDKQGFSGQDFVNPNHVLAENVSIDDSESVSLLRRELETPPLPVSPAVDTPPPLPPADAPSGVKRGCTSTPPQSHRKKLCTPPPSNPQGPSLSNPKLLANNSVSSSELEVLATLPLNQTGKIELTQSQLRQLLGTVGGEFGAKCRLFPSKEGQQVSIKTYPFKHTSKDPFNEFFEYDLSTLDSCELLQGKDLLSALE